MTLASGIEVRSEKIADLCRRYHVREMAIFGSAARGDMRIRAGALRDALVIYAEPSR